MIYLNYEIKTNRRRLNHERNHKLIAVKQAGYAGLWTGLKREKESENSPDGPTILQEPRSDGLPD